MVIKDPDTDVAEDVLAPELQRELLNHQGEWVAISRDALLASGNDRDEVVREAREHGHRTPIVYFVPRDGSKSMFF